MSDYPTADAEKCYNADWNSTGVRNKLHEWDEIYLKDARKRLQKDLRGIELTTQDVRMMVRAMAVTMISAVTR